MNISPIRLLDDRTASKKLWEELQLKGKPTLAKFTMYLEQDYYCWLRLMCQIELAQFVAIIIIFMIIVDHKFFTSSYLISHIQSLILFWANPFNGKWSLLNGTSFFLVHSQTLQRGAVSSCIVHVGTTAELFKMFEKNLMKITQKCRKRYILRKRQFFK